MFNVDFLWTLQKIMMSLFYVDTFLVGYNQMKIRENMLS